VQESDDTQLQKLGRSDGQQVSRRSAARSRVLALRLAIGGNEEICTNDSALRCCAVYSSPTESAGTRRPQPASILQASSSLCDIHYFGGKKCS
jgi:hypothetical protein